MPSGFASICEVNAAEVVIALSDGGGANCGDGEAGRQQAARARTLMSRNSLVCHDL